MLPSKEPQQGGRGLLRTKQVQANAISPPPKNERLILENSPFGKRKHMSNEKKTVGWVI